MEKELSIILVNWNTRDLLKECLKSLYKTVKNVSFEVYVADNASTDGSVDMTKEDFPEVRLIENEENIGFGRANNRVLRDIETPYVFLLNTDTILLDGSVEGMLSFLKANPDVAIVSPQYLNADGTKQNSFTNLPSLATELLNKSLLKMLFPRSYPSKRQDYSEPLEVESIVGAAMMLRQEVFRRVRFFDEDYFLYLDESDLCFRLRKAGWKCYFLPHLKIYHLGGGGTKKKARGDSTIEYYRSLYKFFRKNRGGPAYWALRVLKPSKLLVNLISSALAAVATLFLHEGLRGRFLTYLKVMEWHLRGCPEDMGILGRVRREQRGGAKSALGGWALKEGR